jgi:hypothetical protein
MHFRRTTPSEIRDIIEDIKKAYKVRGFETESGLRMGWGFIKGNIQTLDDTLYVLGNVPPDLIGRGLVATHSRCNSTTYLYSILDKGMTKIRSGVIIEDYCSKIAIHGIRELREYAKDDCILE